MNHNNIQDAMTALEIAWPPLERVEAGIARLAREKREAGTRMTRLRSEEEGARRADQERYAAALLEGAGKPERSLEAELAAEREDLEARSRALDLAIRKLALERARIVRENAESWRSEILARLPALQERIAESVAELRAAVEKVNHLATVYSFVRNPDLPPSRKTPVGKVHIGVTQVSIEAALSQLQAQVERLEEREPEPAAAAEEEGSEGAA